MERSLELLGFDYSGRLSLPAQLLEISRGNATSKRVAVVRAPEQLAPKAARRLTAFAFQELKVDRLEELSGRLSQIGTGNSSTASAGKSPPPPPLLVSASRPLLWTMVQVLGGALLRIATALEQKHVSAGTVQDAFGLNEAFFGDQSVREAPRAGRLGDKCAGAKGGENPQRETRGGHCCSRGQGTQGPQRPRGRIMVLAQTRRRVLPPL